jgi:hypothetical protein
VFYSEGVGSAQPDFEKCVVICADQSEMGDAAESRFCAVGWGTVGVELDRFQNRRGGTGRARLAAPDDDRRGERN